MWLGWGRGDRRRQNTLWMGDGGDGGGGGVNQRRMLLYPGGGRVLKKEGEERMGKAYPPTKGQSPVSALGPTTCPRVYISLRAVPEVS